MSIADTESKNWITKALIKTRNFNNFNGLCWTHFYILMKYFQLLLLESQ
jgi:hypothetical protein